MAYIFNLHGSPAYAYTSGNEGDVYVSVAGVTYSLEELDTSKKNKEFIRKKVSDESDN